MSGHPAVQQALRNNYFDQLGLPRLYVPEARHNMIEPLNEGLFPESDCPKASFHRELVVAVVVTYNRC